MVGGHLKVPALGKISPGRIRVSVSHNIRECTIMLVNYYPIVKANIYKELLIT